MKKIKIYIEPYPIENFCYLYTCPRTTRIIHQGLNGNNDIDLVCSPNDADFIIWSYVPHTYGEKWNNYDLKKYPASKIVIIDNSDENNKYYTENFFLYFKRSVCQQIGFDKVYVQQPDKVYPFTYAIMDEFLDLSENKSFADRTIDLGCYLRTSCYNRSIIFNFINSFPFNVNKWIGPVNEGSRSILSKPFFNREYFSYLNNTKIIVTCGPTEYSGDSRLWEALSSGALVITDRDNIPLDNLLIDNQHVIYYDIGNLLDLRKKITYYLNHLNEAERIGQQGKIYGITYHSSQGRIKYVVNKIKETYEKNI